MDTGKQITVLGAGVIGLTTAIVIQEKGGYNVTMVAERLPTDPKSIDYTSHWAGAHHVSIDTDNQLQRELERRTFKTLWELSEPGTPTAGLFLRARQTEHFIRPRSEDDPLKAMPNHQVLPKDKLFRNAVDGATFDTVNINAPQYLPYLFSRFQAAGGKVVRATVQSIDQVINPDAPVTSVSVGDGPMPASVDALIVCLGLGARKLAGVDDKNVYPIRGQTVIMNAPWIRSGVAASNEKGAFSYIIPRVSGEVVVGGTREPNDWYPAPRPDTKKEILGNAIALCPELAPPEVRAIREPTVEDVLPLVIEEGCGFRPARKGGIRLEVEWFQSGATFRAVPVVHNYGHGGYGFQMSWASADKVLDLLEGALGNTNAP
ncbi:hypothetical protein APHAL10511_002488 [Amanita phalloides]|nr:hypothetical protein APHAL10511_002488 [Amanita phalloides]